MATVVRTVTREYRGYLIDITEWCGSWQPRPWPLASDLPLPSDALLVDATAPSFEAALSKARQLIDRLLRHPPEADRPIPRPIPAPEPNA